MFTAPVGTVPNKDIIEKAIDYNEAKLVPEYKKLDDYYRGFHWALQNRIKKSSFKDNKITVNQAKYITDINVGYLVGNPVEYQSEKKLDPILEAYKKQTIADEDSELAKMLSKFGVAFELTYADEKNDLYSKAIDPRNCIIVYDDTFQHKPLFAITYQSKKSDHEYTEVTTYTATEIQKWGVRLGAGEITSHVFGAVPVIEARNNPDKTGDYQPVLSIIDGIDILQSDRVNDKEQLVESILVVYGGDMTPDQKKELKESRVMVLDKEGKAEYLVKSLNETEIEVLKKSLEQDLHKISMTPNLSDENFVGNASGVAIRYKLIAFEQNIQNKERYLERALKDRFALYNTYLSVNSKMEVIPSYEIDVVFKRNLPQNDIETATLIMQLKGMVSDETLVGLLSFVDDASAEIKAAQQDALKRAELLAEQFGTAEESQPKDDNADDSAE